MIAFRCLVVFLFVLPLVIQGESNEKIYETYFNGYCYWSEEVSYHVHYLSDCKVYFTCQHGKFLDFHRCPESTVFNIETRKCDPNGICKPRQITNPAFEDWWERVVRVIDDVVKALENNTAVTQNETSSTASSKISQVVADSSTVVLPSPTILTSAIFQAEIPLAEGTDSTDQLFTIGSENDAKETRILPTVIESISDSTKELELGVSSSGFSESSFLIEPSSVADSLETNQTSVHLIPMQFDSLTSLLADNFNSTAVPLHEDIVKIFDQFDLPPLGEIISPNSTRETDIMTDFILPLIQDILKNATIMAKMNQVFDVFFETADPLLYTILDGRVSEKRLILSQITLGKLKSALNRTIVAIRPALKEFLRCLHPVFFKRVAESGDIIFDYLNRRESGLMGSIRAIFGFVLRMEFKYFFFSDTESINSLLNFSILDMREDIQELVDTLKTVIKDKTD